MTGSSFFEYSIIDKRKANFQFYPKFLRFSYTSLLKQGAISAS